MIKSSVLSINIFIIVIKEMSFYFS